MSYVQVVSDKKLKGSGLERGDILLVTGTKLVPASRQDPYLMREILVTVYVEPNGNHHIPNSKSDYQAYLIDPRSVTKLNAELSAELNEHLVKQYGG